MPHISSHRRSFIGSVAIHIAIVLALFLRLTSSPVHNLDLQPDVNIIKAVAINPADLVAQQTKLIQQQKAQQEAVEKAQEAKKLVEQQQAAKALAAQREKEAQAAAQKKATQDAQKQALKKVEAAAILAEQQAEQKSLEQKAAVQKKETQKAAAEKAVQQQKQTQKAVVDKEVQQQKQALQQKQAQKAAIALKLAQQKELDQQMAAEKKQLDAAKTAQQQTEIEKYTALMLHSMRQNWIVPESVDPAISCQLSIKLNSDGKVLSVTLLRSSGNAALDNSARLAVFKSSPLPVPADPDLFNQYFKEFNLTMSPRDIK